MIRQTSSFPQKIRIKEIKTQKINKAKKDPQK
jgi:hypothetical protein